MLWTRYIKSNIYKFEEAKSLSKELKTSYVFKAGDYQNNVENFIRLYDDSNTQISVIKINGIITNKSNKNFSYQLSVTPTKYNIAKLDESDYDLISLDVDSENKSAMTCKNNNGESIIYFFENDKLLGIEAINKSFL